MGERIKSAKHKYRIEMLLFFTKMLGFCLYILLFL